MESKRLFKRKLGPIERRMFYKSEDFVKNHGMFLFSLVLLSFCLCPLSYAELTSEQKAKLEGTLQGYVPEKPIQCISDQTQAIKGAIGFLKARVPSLTGGVDLPKWMTALNRISDHLDAAAPKPIQADYETKAGFAERLQKFEASEEFRKDLMTYFKAKFPVQAVASCSGESATSGVGLDTKNLSSNLKSISEIAAPSNSGALESKADPDLLAQSAGASEDEMRPPSLSVANLFSELIISPHYQGWNVKGKGVGELTLWPRTGLRQDVLSNLDVRNDILLVPINEKPIRLTQETLEFFKTLPEAERVQDGTQMAYKYYFYPEAVLDPNKHDIGRPIVFYLIKDVPKNAKEGQFLNFRDSQEWKKEFKQFAEKRTMNRVLFEKYIQAVDLIENESSDKGMHNLKLAAKSGVSPAAGAAAVKVAALLQAQGQGKEKELEKYLRLAADQYDHPMGHTFLGYHLLGKKKPEEAEKYLRLAADKHDHPVGHAALGGLLYEQGKFVEAEKYLHVAADKYNLSIAQEILGVFYEQKKDLKRALEYHEKADAQGTPGAALNLGIFYINHNGKFGTKTHAEVIEYFKRAISLGVGITTETDIASFLKEVGQIQSEDVKKQVIEAIQEALQ